MRTMIKGKLIPINTPVKLTGKTKEFGFNGNEYGYVSGYSAPHYVVRIGNREFYFNKSHFKTI